MPRQAMSRTMNAPRFFIAQPIDRGLIGSRIALPQAVAHHATRVLRLASGDPVTLFDGKGGEFAAHLEDVGRAAAGARLDAHLPIEREAGFELTLVQAVIHAEAMDFAVRKSVELGVAAIAPVFAARSQGLAAERARQRQAHWQAIVVAACEQCGRNRVPAVAAPVHLASWFERADAGSTVVLGPGADLHLASLVGKAMPSCVVIGPEGGFTDGELALARERGATRAHLGPSVLRSETAGPAALAAIAAALEATM